MKSVFLVISISLLILFACFEEHKTYEYKYLGGWIAYFDSTDATIDRGVNYDFTVALNYAYADLLFRFDSVSSDYLNSDNCVMMCQNHLLCDNSTFYFDANNLATCVWYHNATVFQTYQHYTTVYQTLDECSKLCDSNPNCNLFFYKTKYQQDDPICSLFHLFENATVKDAIQIDTSCGDTCQKAWYAKVNANVNVCKSINTAVPDSYCQAYCLYNDAKNPNICTGVQPFMTSICECNNVVNSSYCHSLSASVPDSYCKTYCHINGATCTVDQHMQSICSCSL